ncbi:hypothetical protein Tco_0133138 [Tanacetum coccineum]
MAGDDVNNDRVEQLENSFKRLEETIQKSFATDNLTIGRGMRFCHTGAADFDYRQRSQDVPTFSHGFNNVEDFLVLDSELDTLSNITKTVEEKQHKKKRKMERSETEEPEKKKSNRQKSTYKGTMKKSGSKKNPIIEESPKRFTRGDAKRQAEFENVDKQNEAEDDEDVKSISSDDVIVETKKKGRKSKGKKEGKKMKKAEEETQVESDEDVLYEGNNSDDERLPVGKAKKKQKRRKKSESSTSRSYLIKQSKNDIEEGENNQSEEEEGDRKLTKDKMDKGLKSESEGDEQLKKVTKPKKGKGSKAEKPYPTCNTRSSPKPMYEAMMTLTDPQKKCLKDMGFKRMIHFPIVKLPSALAYHEIDHFHPGSMELRLEKGSIKATRQKVHDMLGIPTGSRKLEDLKQRPSNDPFIKEWEKQFKHVPKPTPAAIALVISDTTEADFVFRMNFITLFESTMGTPDNGGRVSTKLLKRITEDVDISDIDWCGYILDCFHTSKKNWKDVKTRKNFYYGPLTFLCEYYEKIVLKFDIISDERSELVRTLRNGVKKFEDDQMMIDFCKQYRELFNDNEFKLYEYSKDDDSEGETDGDNEDNNHDDDGAPTADANKKKESENQTKERNKEEIDKQTEESGSEGTDESGSEGTEENGSEATEGGSDGKEENMNGDEREVTAHMDVDSQNKELNKEKDANETEDNDKMNNIDMKNDSIQEKQDTNKDENAKVDNCEELENQAKEEIKKKTAKRKTVIEMTPPSFSLGLSPDTNKMEDGKKYDEKKQYKAFSDTMKNEFKKDNEVKKLKDLEMKNMFSMYLKEVQHPKAKEVLNKKPTILRPKWGTKENNTDCRVFLMMHMENYNGENARNWDMEFPTEE